MFNWSKSTTPQFTGVFNSSKSTPRPPECFLFIKALPNSRSVLPHQKYYSSEHGVFSSTTSTTPGFTECFTSSKSTTPQFTGVFNSSKSTTPQFTECFTSSKVLPNYSQSVYSSRALPGRWVFSSHQKRFRVIVTPQRNRLDPSSNRDSLKQWLPRKCVCGVVGGWGGVGGGLPKTSVPCREMNYCALQGKKNTTHVTSASVCVCVCVEDGRQHDCALWNKRHILPVKNCGEGSPHWKVFRLMPEAGMRLEPRVNYIVITTGFTCSHHQHYGWRKKNNNNSNNNNSTTTKQENALNVTNVCKKKKKSKWSEKCINK